MPQQLAADAAAPVQPVLRDRQHAQRPRGLLGLVEQVAPAALALTVVLRPGNAGSNIAADYIAVIKEALAQLPGDVLAWMAR